ncbi:MAG: hypothetical protein A2Z32_12595 [Chloroflexi bacterium RBG_16_69_14]|nr:MAG: hypothetical protein A2Z32_12595 [Chloroflexi bacterium RBG_16_69_14]
MSDATLPVAGLLVPAGHRVVHLAPEDGRELWASPAHSPVPGMSGIRHEGRHGDRDRATGTDRHASRQLRSRSAHQRRGTGHWAMSVGLNEGQNDLVFRIGDDRSTERRLRVVFTPAPAS